MNLKIFFQLYIRSLGRNKFQSITQLVGLSIGISVAILVFLFLQSELSYDRFHENHKNIYKYGIEMQIGDADASRQSSANPSAGPLFADYIPEILKFARTHYTPEIMVKRGNEIFFESSFRWMDSTGLEIFNFPTIIGDPTTALDDPFSIVLTEDLATKYFGSDNPVGKTLELEDLGLFTVTAVVEKPPRETDISFTALLSYHTQFVETPEIISPSRLFGGMGTNIYFLVQDGFKQEEFDQKLKQYYDENMADVDRINYVSLVEPIRKIHLSSIIQTSSATRNRGFFAGFLTIGVIVLILSIINYINISTAGFMSRAKEVAVKKTLGRIGPKITRQFLLESGLNTLIALVIGISITEIVLSFTSLNQLLNKDLDLSLIENPILVIGIMSLFLITSIMAGIYPAIGMARTRPLHHLRGESGGTSKSGKTRTILVGFQFILSTTSIIMILLMSRQISFLNKMDLGFDKNNLLVINSRTDQITEGMEAFRQDIQSNAQITSAGFSNAIPGYGINGNAFQWENNDGEMEIHAFQTMLVDRQFPSTLGIEMIEGIDFMEFEGSDSVDYFLVNQALVDYMGWGNPIGMTNQYGEVIGVMNNINLQSARADVRPAFMLMNNAPSDYLLVRLNGEDRTKTVEYIKSTWEKHFQGIPFEHSFVDETLSDGFERERNQQRLFIFLVIICIVLSGLGLLGVTAHMLNKRTKEVAIRKVFGATILQVIIPLFRPLIIVLSSAMIISIPLVLFMYSKWLVNFAFDQPASPFIFFLVFLGIILFAISISSYHGLIVARARPVDKIKCE